MNLKREKFLGEFPNDPTENNVSASNQEVVFGFNAGCFGSPCKGSPEGGRPDPSPVGVGGHTTTVGSDSAPRAGTKRAIINSIEKGTCWWETVDFETPAERTTIYASFIEHLNEFTNVSGTSIGDLKRQQAILRAREETESFVVLLQFEIDNFQEGRLVLNSPDLEVKYFIFAPGTGEQKTKGKVYYQAIGGAKMRKDNWPNGPPIKITVEAAGIEAAERVHDWLLVTSRQRSSERSGSHSRNSSSAALNLPNPRSAFRITGESHENARASQETSRHNPMFQLCSKHSGSAARVPCFTRGKTIVPNSGLTASRSSRESRNDNQPAIWFAGALAPARKFIEFLQCNNAQPFGWMRRHHAKEVV